MSALVKSLGAHHVFDYGQADWSTKVSDVEQRKTTGKLVLIP
jgi:NADPH:quinone reductase-like Zn-dependent oxidoreductase